MNISNQTRTSVVTIPWGPGAKVPPEHIEDELRIRDTMSSFTHLATTHLMTAENANNGWSRDRDPSPERVLRSREVNGTTYVAAVTAENPEASPKKQLPSEWSMSSSDKSESSHVVWENGEIVSFSLSRVADNKTYGSDFQVNDNETLTWTLSVADGVPQGG